MIIAVDFDGTIVEHAYPAIGWPAPFALEVLRRLQDEGRHQLILWTVREGDLLQDAVDYCRRGGVEFYAVNQNFPGEEKPSPRKLAADLFIDDRNLGGLPDWTTVYQMITSGRSFTYLRMEKHVAHANNPPKRKNFFIRLGEALEKAQGK